VEAGGEVLEEVVSRVLGVEAERCGREEPVL